MVSVAFVVSAWGSRFGGINAFNTDLCVAIAQRRPDIAVHCVTVGATRSEILDALSKGVQLANIGDSQDQGNFGTVFARALADWARDIQDLQWWVGHDVITGRAVVLAAKSTGTRAAVIQHTDYASYGSLKGTEGPVVLRRDQAETRTLSEADVLFGVGPKLAAAALDRVRSTKGPTQVTQLVPGLPDIDAAPRAPNTFRAITFGRLDPESDRIKQGRLAVRSFGELIGQVPDMVGPDPRITVVGLSARDLHREEDELAALAGEAAQRMVAVVGHHFTEEREILFHALSNSSVSLMLSVHEGFGLTGWEAIAAEVPLILTRNSGLYELLANLGGSAVGCLRAVDIRGQRQAPFYSDHDIMKVTGALREVAHAPEEAKRDARALKSQLTAYQWANTADLLLDGLGLSLSVRGIAGGRKQPETRVNIVPQAILPPAGEDAFVGRSEQIADLESSLRSGAARLITVLGPPGAGKTRLVTELAPRVRGAFDNRVYFVDLANVAQPDLVAASIMRVVRVEPHDPVLDALKEFFRWSPALLILDNFDHVISAALVLRELITGAPLLQVLATSREPLRVAGEVEFRLNDLSTESAVALFRERQGNPVTNTAESPAAIAELCRSVDNLPLAIEIVAAHAQLYPPSEVLELIRNSPLDVSTTRRDATDRQRSLRAAIDWSYALLSDSEAMAFRRLSVFADGWSLKSASTVLSDVDGLDPNVAVDMTALFTKSLIRRGLDGRLRMLDTLRAYAAERLAADRPQHDLTRTRHARFFLRFLKGMLSESTSRTGGPGLEAARAEMENCDTALRWFSETGMRDEAALMCALLGRLWWSTDFIRGFSHLEAFLNAFLTERPSRVDAVVWLWHGRIGLRLGRLDAANDSFRRSIATAVRIGDGFLTATARGDAALVLIERGQLGDARDLLVQAGEWFESHPDQPGHADILDSLGIIDAAQGEYLSGLENFNRSYELYAARDDQVGIGWVENDRAALALAQMQYPEAVERAAVARDIGDRQRDRALQCWADHYRGLGYCGLAMPDRARGYLLQAAATARLLGDQRLTILALESYAVLHATEGTAIRAVSLAEAASQLRARVGIPRNGVETILLERHLQRAHSKLDSASIAAAQRHGRSLSLERAMDYAELE